MHDGSFSYVWRNMFHIGGFFFFFSLLRRRREYDTVWCEIQRFLMPLFVWKGSSQTRTDFLLAPSVMWTSWRQCDMEWKVTSVGSSIRFRLLIKTHLSFLPHVVLMLLGDCGVWSIDQLELIINLLFFFPLCHFSYFPKLDLPWEFVPCFTGQVYLILFLGVGGLCCSFFCFTF